jgi:hypothetical protein
MKTLTKLQTTHKYTFMSTYVAGTVYSLILIATHTQSYRLTIFQNHLFSRIKEIDISLRLHQITISFQVSLRLGRFLNLLPHFAKRRQPRWHPKMRYTFTHYSPFRSGDTPSSIQHYVQTHINMRFHYTSYRYF